MKKIILIFITGILITASLTSCTQNDPIVDEFLAEQQGCCGEGENPPPPPPPPPPTGEGD